MNDEDAGFQREQIARLVLDIVQWVEQQVGRIEPAFLR
jgi:hypothetical protein